MELWNEINLPIPLLQACKMSKTKIGKELSCPGCALSQQNRFVDLNRLNKVLQETVDFFQNLDEFHLEATQLSRLIFMNCKQYRMMNGLHELKKTHQALLRYFNMDVVTAIESFKGFVCEETSSKVTVPYRESLDFILIKLQGLSKVLIRAIESSKKSARYFLGFAKAGNFHVKGVVFISSIASVWNKCREICKFVVQQYSKLREFRENLQRKPGVNWIDGGYEIPESLEKWLGEDYECLVINQSYDVKLLLRDEDLAQFQKTINVFDRVKSENVQASLVEDVGDKLEECKIDELELEDFAPISRNLLKAAVPMQTEAPIEHSTLSLTSKDAVKRFIKTESGFRKVDQKKSLTINKMKNKTWKEFKENIKNKLVLMQENVFIDFVNDYLEEYKIQ